MSFAVISPTRGERVLQIWQQQRIDPRAAISGHKNDSVAVLHDLTAAESYLGQTISDTAWLTVYKWGEVVCDASFCNEYRTPPEVVCPADIPKTKGKGSRATGKSPRTPTGNGRKSRKAVA